MNRKVIGNVEVVTSDAPEDDDDFDDDGDDEDTRGFETVTDAGAPEEEPEPEEEEEIDGALTDEQRLKSRDAPWGRCPLDDFPRVRLGYVGQNLETACPNCGQEYSEPYHRSPVVVIVEGAKATKWTPEEWRDLADFATKYADELEKKEAGRAEGEGAESDSGGKVSGSAVRGGPGGEAGGGVAAGGPAVRGGDAGVPSGKEGRKAVVDDVSKLSGGSPGMRRPKEG
jgi:hypothetical protein